MEEQSDFAEDSFAELVEAEPGPAGAEDAAHWVDVYSRLVAMLDRQLAETRAFASASPEALQRYLDRANLSVLVEEHQRFTERLAHWRARLQATPAEQ